MDTKPLQRVAWAPGRNSEREALRRHPGPWEIAWGTSNRQVRGEGCLLIHPPGRPNDARWVALTRITFLPKES